MPLTAEEVCNDINARGGNALEIDRWHASGWAGHICGLPFNNFELLLGSSYFIKSGSQSTWEIEGYQVTEPLSLTLHVGWTSIGIPHTDLYSAHTLCDEIIAQGVTAVEIDRWHNGGWQGYICGLPFNHFQIERGVGYFIKSSSAGTVTPSVPQGKRTHLMQDRAPNEVPAGPRELVRNLRVSNLRDRSVTLSWTTDSPTTGYVRYGENRELGQVAYDGRGAQLSAETHFVVLTNLKPETSYYFKVVSGVEGDRDTLQTITTMSTLESVPQSDTVYGQVYMADGITPATGALVYLTLQDADGTGDTGKVTLLSALVDENGYWHANLGNARLADGRLFDYSVSGDELLIKVQGSDTPLKVDTAHDAPAPDIIINKANEPTSITVGAFNATLPFRSLLGMALAPLALVMLAGTFLIWRRRRL